jgi:hypothetical protein
MALVLDLDQRSSSTGPDLVAEYSAALNADCAEILLRPFARTAGDEMQAVLGEPTGFAGLMDRVLDAGTWWIGVGIGEITRLGESTRESAGPAFKAARAAIEAAKRDRASSGPAVRGEPAELAASLQAALAGVAFIRAKRTARQREVVAAALEADAQRTAAHRLGITQQGVSDALQAAGYDAERQLRGLVSRLAAEAVAL